MKILKNEKKYKNTSIYANSKGVTLVVLVVTIIILLILAGVAIRSIIGDDGVINQSTKASGEHKYKSEIETAETQIEYIKDGSNVGKVDLKTTQDRINRMDEVSETTINDDGTELTIKFKDGKQHTISGVLVDEDSYWKRKGLDSSKICFNKPYESDEEIHALDLDIKTVEMTNDEICFYNANGDEVLAVGEEFIEELESNKEYVPEELWNRLYKLESDKWGFINVDEEEHDGLLFYFSDNETFEIYYRQWENPFTEEEIMNSVSVLDVLDENYLVGTFKIK